MAQRGTAWRTVDTIRSGSNGQVGVEKKKEKKSDPVGMCFLTRGLQNW
jgi:hypothetical protein